jgi:hypothetical protein
MASRSRSLTPKPVQDRRWTKFADGRSRATSPTTCRRWPRQQFPLHNRRCRLRSLFRLNGSLVAKSAPGAFPRAITTPAVRAVAAAVNIPASPDALESAEVASFNKPSRYVSPPFTISVRNPSSIFEKSIILFTQVVSDAHCISRMLICQAVTATKCFRLRGRPYYTAFVPGSRRLLLVFTSHANANPFAHS